MPRRALQPARAEITLMQAEVKITKGLVGTGVQFIANPKAILVELDALVEHPTKHHTSQASVSDGQGLPLPILRWFVIPEDVLFAGQCGIRNIAFWVGCAVIGVTHACSGQNSDGMEYWSNWIFHGWVLLIMLAFKIFRGGQGDHAALISNGTVKVIDHSVVLHDPGLVSEFAIPRLGGTNEIGAGPFRPIH